MTEKIYVYENGVRKEAKGEQLNYILQAQAEAQETQRLFEDEQTAKAAAKESGKAKLAALGLTEEEVNAILGGI